MSAYAPRPVWQYPGINAPPPPYDEFRLGVIIGLALSFANLLGKLPDFKPAFLVNLYLLNWMLGGYQYGKTKVATAFLVNVFCRSFELLVDTFWDTFGETISESMANNYQKMSSSQAVAVLPFPRSPGVAAATFLQPVVAKDDRAAVMGAEQEEAYSFAALAAN